MWKYPPKEIFFDSFEKHAKTAGIIFMVLGFAGAVFPVAASMATVVFVSWLMLVAGLFAGYFTYMTDRSDWTGWLKSFILIGVALYMLLSPLGGVATLGLLFSIYFFMDAFTGFTLASTAYPNKGWGLWAFNAVLSLVIAILFVIDWPFSSMYLIGLFVGFSLFFDGLALLMGAKFFKDMTNNEE
ncbi:MAG: hypothetical protein P794_03170 [Epsilonproteobacteria bacterium (ex Lamellibrachia satsuma)]|nr:MAG: hypothetical protein P794_03170 [Epsilonproteobacteria bacterium (ex Lamellibrachia satsuma)]